jgi:serine/threonine protein kinase
MYHSDGEFYDTERFKIRRKLGSGGMGVVYEAFDRRMNIPVALKTLLRLDPAALYRFKNEFRALADVTHQNLVLLYDLVAEENIWFFTMELVEGVNYLDYLRRGSKRITIDSLPTSTVSPLNLCTDAESDRTVDLAEMLATDTQGAATTRSRSFDFSVPLDRLRSSLRQLAQGVHALHQIGKLHRDLKPSNVLVTPEGRVVILDFGLITELTPDWHSHSLNIVGTPVYMSPEQGAGKRITEASDWYSFGVILYEAITGQHPFTGHILEILMKKQRFEPRPPSDLVSGVPEDLDSLCRKLLRRDPEARPSGHDVLKLLQATETDISISNPPMASSQGVMETPFVGREQQLAALEDAYSATKGGEAVSVYIYGVSGMGKTALARHFLERLRLREQVVVLTGRCYEQESVPYKAMDGIIDSLSRYLTSLPKAKADALMPRDILALSRLFPVLLRVESVMEAPHREQDIPDPLVLRRRAFAVLRDLLARISDRHHLVLYIDDLQWADADSIALIEDLLRPPDPPPLLLLVSFRSEEIESKPFLKQLLKQADGHTRRGLPVDLLSREEVSSLISSMTPERLRSDNEFVEKLVVEAEGSPFFAEQLTRYAVSDYQAITRGVNLAEMIEARISRLPAGTRQMLETLAVAGRPLQHDVVFEVAGSENQGLNMVAALRTAHFLRGAGSGDQIELYHDRIRETISARIPPDAVRRIHQDLARVLGEKGYDDPEALFEHCLGAGEREQAAVYAVLAAKKATAALAFDRAAIFYRHALDLSWATGADLLELKAELGDALANAGRCAEAAHVFLDAAKEADIEKALEFQRRAAEKLLISGHIDEGLSVIRTVLGAVGMKIAKTPRHALVSILARRAQLRLRGLGFVERQASEIPESELQRIEIYWSVTTGLSMVDIIRATDFQTRHLLLALKAGEPYRIARALAVEAGYAAAPGGPGKERSAVFTEAAEAVARKVGHPHAIGLATMTAGAAAFCLGQWKKAAELSERAEEILRDQCTGVAWELTNAQNFFLGSLLFLGEMGKISNRMPGLVAAAEERGNLYCLAEMKTRTNVAWLVADEPDEARRQVLQAMQQWSRKGFFLQHYNAVYALSQVDLYGGDADRAFERITSKWPELARTLLLRVQVLRVEARHLHARSALMRAARRKEIKPSLKIAERLADQIEREKMAWSEPMATAVRAGVAAVRGDELSAVTLLTAAAEKFHKADMRLYAAAAERCLGGMIGGERGRQLVDESTDWMKNQKIKNPDCVTRMLVPGFADC